MESPTTLNLHDFLSEHKVTGYQWSLYVMLLVILLFDGVAVAAAGFSNTHIMPSFGLNPKTDASQMMWALSAVQFGSAAGALIAGPIADKFGRKNVVIVSTLIVAVFMFITAFSTGPNSLMIWRFLTGLGLGGSVANCVPLFSEFCPPQRRSFLTTIMYLGFPFGSGIAGLVAGLWLLKVMSWQHFFMLMGALPLVLTIIFFFFIPESVRYMVYSGKPVERIRATLSRIAPVSDSVTSVDSGEKAVTEDEKKAGAALVVSRSYIVGSVMLWLTYFAGLMVVYAIQNWLPTMLQNHGYSAPASIVITGIFQLGAIGSIIIGFIMDRANPNIALAICYGLTAVAVMLMGPTVSHMAIFVVMVVLGGLFVNTGQSAMPSLAAMFYPAQGRATGVSWMIGIGKFGGFIGTLIMGWLIPPFTKDGNTNFTPIFLIIGAIVLISMVALIIKNAAYRKAVTETAAAK